MYLEGFGQDLPAPVVNLPAPDVPSAGTIVVTGQRPVNWWPWLIGAALVLALVYYLAQERRQHGAAT
jgi:hypothetical protein